MKVRIQLVFDVPDTCEPQYVDERIKYIQKDHVRFLLMIGDVLHEDYELYTGRALGMTIERED